MKNLSKLLFFVLLTMLVVSNTQRINQRPEIYINNDIIQKVNELDYRPTNLIDASVTVHSANSRGSGSIIKVEKKATLILTAAHVVFEQIIVRNTDGKLKRINIPSRNITVKLKKKKYKALLVKIDRELDIAVVKIFKRLNIKPVKIAKKEPEVGEIVWLISSPNGQLSALNRGTFSSVKEDHAYVSTAGHFGSSGGMIVNTKGEQIGVIATIWLTQVNGFFPSVTIYNGITRTKDLNKFLKGIL